MTWTLFGEVPDDIAKKRGPKIDRAHAAPPGTGPEGETCGSCAFLRVRERSGRYFK